LSIPLSIIKETIIPILQEFIKSKFIDNNFKKYIVLVDNYYCIPKLPDNDQYIEIFRNNYDYTPLFHYNPIERYIKIKQEIYRKPQNTLIITDKIKLLKSYTYQSDKISPKKVLDFYFLKRFNITVNFSEEINEFSFLIWHSLNFIEKHYKRFEKKIENNGFIEILFRELIEVDEEPVFFLKKMLFNSNLLFTIFKNTHLNQLKIRIKTFLEKSFPCNFAKLIEKCILLQDFKEILNLLIIISYIRQYNENLNNIESAFEYINKKTHLIQKLDYLSDIKPIFDDVKLLDSYSVKLIKLSTDIILTKKESKVKIIKHNFNFTNIIKKIENHIDLFEIDPTNHSLIFFPQIKEEKELIKNLFYDIPYYWISHNFLEYYIDIALTSIFNKQCFIDLKSPLNLYIVRNNKSIDLFKENVFYKLGDASSKYIIMLNYLENFFAIILFMYYLNRDVIPTLKSIKNDELKWKNIFKKYIIPLNDCLEAFIENSLQFIPSFATKIENYTSQLERKVFAILKQINNHFREYLWGNYRNWVKNADNKSNPLNVVNAFRRLFIPNYKSKGDKFYLILFIDCCHLNIWNILKQQIFRDFPYFKIRTEVGFSILPTLTKYARVALFSGKYPKDFDSSNELFMFLKLIGKTGLMSKVGRINKHFVTNCENMFDFKLNIDNIKNCKENFQISIFNFSDQTSHTYSQNFLKTLINSIYNAKIRPLLELVSTKFKDFLIFFATDHGSSRCTKSFDWKDNAFNFYWEIDKRDHNLFYKKAARTFISFKTPNSFNEIKKEIICLKNSETKAWGLPNLENGKNVNYFFADNYCNLKKTPVNRRELENFGHGGSSMDEFIIPFALIQKDPNIIEFNWKLDIESSVKQDSRIKKKLVIEIKISNNSNKDITFHEGHFITNFLHYKIISKDKDLININNEKIIRIGLPSKFYSQNASFYFTFYHEEKLETSTIYKL